MADNSFKPLLVAAAASAAASLIWVLLAWRTPTSTFHFAPLIGAGVGPYMAKASAGRMPSATTSMIIIASTAIVLIATAILAFGTRLQGPTFWSDDGALLESLIFIAIGSTIGFAILVARPAQVTN